MLCYIIQFFKPCDLYFPGGPVVKSPLANAWDMLLSWEDSTYLGQLLSMLSNKISHHSEKPAHLDEE